MTRLLLFCDYWEPGLPEEGERKNITSQPCLSWRVVSQRIHNAGLRDFWWVIFTHSHVFAARDKRRLHAATPSADAESNSSLRAFRSDWLLDGVNLRKDGRRKLVLKTDENEWIWRWCVLIFQFYHCRRRRHSLSAAHQLPQIKVRSNLSGIRVVNESREGKKKLTHVHSLRRLLK